MKAFFISILLVLSFSALADGDICTVGVLKDFKDLEAYLKNKNMDCIEEATKQHLPFERAAAVCANVHNMTCFSWAYKVKFTNVTAAAQACRGPIGDACFKKMASISQLDEAVSTCRDVSSDACFSNAVKVQLPKDAARVCKGAINDVCFLQARKLNKTVKEAVALCKRDPI